MAELGIFLVFLVLSVGGGLLLWSAVDSEKRQRRVMDRGSAEKAARRDTSEDGDERRGF
ncbi:hypothetical protein M0R89_14105 [Halorussus limi]|uniref:Uncharacterized protein n=1 Tax=Halorussus limi TaxID=2938695 RepID=A0A8U0HS15_9EURY|nr:hypothetical protein [Halorussus limi]UPV73667.1 hypothetical protein M0R89_14105 [Halorussus limi]